MGGYGSGYRWSSKGVVEGHTRLDILRMNQEGYLRTGCGGLLTWSRNGEKVGSINFRSEVGSIRLIYKSRPYGGEWQDVEMDVQIYWANCRFGGSRPYFVCPGRGCRKYVQHLYAGNPYFVCRHCMNLAYTSQREQLFDRAARRAQKLRERAGDSGSIFDGDIYQKPKGMHWKTFKKLQRKETHYRELALWEARHLLNILGEDFIT
ncbi:MAG: hypothetical protein H6912_06660 [Kordiimonadaceae bacterium]|nr:hypothetical protein [Kordiimonadaceae bacterium]